MMNRTFAVNVVAQGLARVLSTTASIALTLVVARTMGVSAFGQFSYILAFAAIAATLADLGTTAVLARGLASVPESGRAAYLGNFLLMRLALVLLATFGAAAAAVAWPAGQLHPMLIAAAGVPVIASRFFDPIYQVYGCPWLSLWSNLVFATAQLGLAVAVWLYPDMDLMRLILGYVASNVLYALVALVFMLRLVRPRMRPHPQLLRSIVLVSAPIGVSAIFTTVIARVDLIVLEHLRSSVEVGLYSAASRFVEIAVFAAVTIVTPLIPVLSREILEDRVNAIARCRQLVQLVGLCTLPVAIVMPVIADDLLALILGPAYLAAADALTVMSWNVVLIALTLLGSSVNLANGVVRHGYWNSPLACAVNLALNFWLIPLYGIVGAAWAALGGQLSMMIVSHYYTFAYFGTLYDRRIWSRLVGACALMLAIQALSPLDSWTLAAASLTAYLAAVAALGLISPGLLVRLCRFHRNPGPAA